MNQSELFPETLLVEIDPAERQCYTTSVRLAEHFGRSHRYVMKVIRSVIADSPEAEQVQNFLHLFETFTVGNGGVRKREIYRLTHDGFAIVSMGFTGTRALEWRWKFLAAFREMERVLLSQLTRESAALYQLRQRWKPIVQQPDASRQALIALTGHRSPASITACRRRMRQVGLLPK